MNFLEKSLRNKLEKTVKAARDIAEEAARVALEHLGVGLARPLPHLSAQAQDLRRKLRAHGRQLGDERDQKTETQPIDRLLDEVAYQHWHRMLFARFLAENQLLMTPDPEDPVVVTLDDCHELATEQGKKSGWELAAHYAAHMLPQIFRPDSPVFALDLPPERQQDLEKKVSELPKEVFTASDSLGWVYQFWQSKKKEEVNASEAKIGARELPAVTQLFTEQYMVDFLLENSLGAWWAAKHLTPTQLSKAASEEDLRKTLATESLTFPYLRFIKTDQAKWTPAAGTFSHWPDKLSDFKVLDPCCGSGHFLVAAFHMLVPMRMSQEGLSAQAAVDAVLRDNLHGLEIDPRCVELAAFALALAAWRYPNTPGYRKLPELNLACSGTAVSVSKEDWTRLANGNAELKEALAGLYDEFKNAPILGSLINPAKTSATKGIPYDDLAQSVERALRKERSEDQHEAGVAAAGLAKAAHMLATNHHWVITNVPYLASGKQGEVLKEFCEHNHKEAKNDLATVFLERCLAFCHETSQSTGGAVSLVLPQNWLFLSSYKKLREKLLKNETWRMIARLGPGAFETISGEVVKAILLTLSHGKMAIAVSGPRTEPRDLIAGVDVSSSRTAAEKAGMLSSSEIVSIEQTMQTANLDSCIVLDNRDTQHFLCEYANRYLGLGTGDFDQFGRTFWEASAISDEWSKLQTAPQGTNQFEGYSNLVAWDKSIQRVRGMSEGHRSRIHNQDQSGQQAWGKAGVAVSLMKGLRTSIYLGGQYDKSVAVLIPKENRFLLPVFAYCRSTQFQKEVRRIDQKIIVANGTLLKVPFDLEFWQHVAQKDYPNGLPQPYADDPTQWIFHGNPAHCSDPLQVAIARLLGYRWPAELDEAMDLSEDSLALLKSCKPLLSLADNDGIVCIPAVRGESTAADRLLRMLAAAYGKEWSNEKMSALLVDADHAGKTLDSWLREKFFALHCKRFHHRPFIWHVWDGLRDGFGALINYHKLDKKLLESLIYTYLGDWITRQKQDRDNGVDGAEEKISAAGRLQKQLELILKGEAPYDIFVRWKPIEEQPIGWEPDLNDGVRLNIRPFVTAGVLRYNKKPHLNISWDKDRGKDVDSAPWFQAFHGERKNDYHLTLAEKEEAQKAKLGQRVKYKRPALKERAMEEEESDMPLHMLGGESSSNGKPKRMK